jgi:phosphate transport system substrate-binding protein
MLRKLMIMCLLAILASCGPAATTRITPTPTRPPLRGRVTFAGSTTVQPLADKLGAVFRQHHPDVALDIAAGGSVVGIQAIHDGTTDIGMASRALKPDEAEGITQHQIAIDVIAVVVHPTNPIKDLTLEQLRAIYIGQIANWKQVGGDDRPITVVVREKNSGTRGAFDELVLENKEPTAPSLKATITAGDMAATVAADPAAIGYVGFGNLESSLKVVSIESVLPSKETARNGSYKLIRPLLLLTGPLSQPLADEYITFVLSDEGQQLVEKDGWVGAH